MRIHPHRQIGLTLSVCLLLLFMAACAPRPYLIVDYRVPAPSEQLAGKKVRIQVKDLRTDKEIFTPAAAKEFQGFKGRYSLAWVTENKERILAGEKDLQGLFFEAFKKRLEQLGVEVVPADREDVPLFQVLLNTLKIDLRDRKWTARASYEANLSVDNQLVARETVTGEAERVKIIGRKGADDTLSDIFTEIINRLNIVKLFQQAKMV